MFLGTNALSRSLSTQKITDKILPYHSFRLCNCCLLPLIPCKHIDAVCVKKRFR